MSTILKIELKKAIKNKGFAIAIIIGMILAVLSLIYCINIYKRDINATVDYAEKFNIVYNPDTASHTIFNKWIGGEGNSLGTSVYFFIFPLLIALPYGWSYSSEKKSGYRKAMIVHCGKKNYYISKYIATFISGGLAMVIPMVFSIIITSCYFPAVKPFVLYDVYYGVFGYDLMSKLYYTYPFLYLFLYLLIDFVFCGILACLCMTAALIIKQKPLVMIMPMALCMGIDYCSKFIYNYKFRHGYLNIKNTSPIRYLKPCSGQPASITIIGCTALILFIITFVVTYGLEKHNEVY